jgi:hypothetical protein
MKRILSAASALVLLLASTTAIAAEREVDETVEASTRNVVAVTVPKSPDLGSAEREIWMDSYITLWEAKAAGSGRCHITLEFSGRGTLYAYPGVMPEMETVFDYELPRTKTFFNATNVGVVCSGDPPCLVKTRIVQVQCSAPVGP